MSKTLVIYIYHIFNDRVKYFIENALFKNDQVDFVIVQNDVNSSYDDINIPDYVKFIKRENKGYDFGAWSDILLTNDFYKNYNYYICCNSSITGPYLSEEEKIYSNGDWTKLYVEGLNKNNVKIYGSTINCMCEGHVKPHVQSYMFCVDKECLEFLIGYEIFSITKYCTSFSEAIFDREVTMSLRIIGNGWNIGSRYKRYKDVDFTFREKSYQEFRDQHDYVDDVMQHNYMNNYWTKEELIFIKGNRF